MTELPDYELTVPAEWIDYNDHLSEGYYGVAFAAAGDWVLEWAGFDAAYRAGERGTFYTAEAQTWFLREVALGAGVAIHTTVLGADAKRLHLFHEMLVGGETCALQESMLLHVDADTGTVVPMAAAIRARFETLAAAHAGRLRPERIGTGVRGMPPA